ncbi:helix-turn-helix transcriptional regulator [Mucilaginibacter paludis]|nr:AraC family transcriptional regulator [Mucilaginibacter paludis]
MPVEFEFQVIKNYHFLTAFAKHFSTIVEGDKVHLPQWLGDGYIQHIRLDGMALFIHNYKLKHDLILRRQAIANTESITLKFDRSKFLSKYSQQQHDPFFDDLTGFEVEIGTCNFNTELKIPANKQINFLIIGTSRSYLTGLLNSENRCTILDLVKTQPSFVIYDVILPEMDHVIKQIIRINGATELPMLLYNAKAQELIYHLFKNLFKRPVIAPVNVKREDAEKIYLVRLAILKNLNSCPLLPELANLSGLGLTKLQKLFTQVFGQSIHQYYQTMRMIQAASLLSNLSVSETAYKLGFTNLSHFTRVFERHHQLKPKQFKSRLTGDTISQS